MNFTFLFYCLSLHAELLHMFHLSDLLSLALNPNYVTLLTEGYWTLDANKKLVSIPARTNPECWPNPDIFWLARIHNSWFGQRTKSVVQNYEVWETTLNSLRTEVPPLHGNGMEDDGKAEVPVGNYSTGLIKWMDDWRSWWRPSKSVWFWQPSAVLHKVIHAGFRQLLGPCHRKCDDIIAATEMRHVIIIGGMTRTLQPLDIIISQPFKTYIWHLHSEWEQTTHEMTTSRLIMTMLTKKC
jgi:hypothetical protein